MKKRNKIGILAIGLIAATFAMSGCTANFCSKDDKSKIAYALEPGVSSFYNAEEIAGIDPEKKESIEINSNLYQFIDVDEDGKYEKSAQLNTIIDQAKNSGYVVPDKDYFAAFDYKVLLKVTESAGIDVANTNHNEIEKALKEFGDLKFYDNESENLFDAYKVINNELREELGYTAAASIDFENAYISSMNTLIDTYRSCITTYDQVEYGNYGTYINEEGKEATITVALDKVTWKEAWKKGGKLIEGLVVYPVAWLVDTFAHSFAGGKSATALHVQEQYDSGVPQLMSLILVTVIVRLFIFLVTFKSTLSQRKMSELQPELARIQQKYPNANTNQNEKQRLAEEQMRLYKKNKVNPLSQLLVLIIQFPVFIGVWGAMTGSAVLSTGSVMGLHLSESIWACLKMGPKHAGWWTALVLIILMSAGQFFSMKVPQWIQKAKTKKVARLGRNPAQNSQNKTANIVSYVMLIMIIVMGFTLPAAMGVYWFIGAIVSLIQTVFTNVIFAGNKKKRK